MKVAALWKWFDEHLAERGQFLWNMYQRMSRMDVPSGPYLDVGTGSSVNAQVFQRNGLIRETVGIDIQMRNRKSSGVMLVRGDACCLPFRDDVFGFATMFSLIEHVPSQDECMLEVLRVLRSDGELFMQFPNRYFPIEFHSALPFYFYFPKRVREFVAKITGRESMKNVDVPRVGKVVKALHQHNPLRQITTSGFGYPKELLPKDSVLRFLYEIYVRLRVYTLIPVGYVILAHGFQPPARMLE